MPLPLSWRLAACFFLTKFQVFEPIGSGNSALSEFSHVPPSGGPLDKVWRGQVSHYPKWVEPSLISHWLRRVCIGFCRTHWERHVPLPCYGGSHPLRTWKRCCGIHWENQQGGMWICNSKCFHGFKNCLPPIKEPLQVWNIGSSGILALERGLRDVHNAFTLWMGRLRNRSSEPC